jgi:hypothetical protein
MELHGTSDLRETKMGRLTWTTTDLQGNVLESSKLDVDLLPNASQLLCECDFSGLLKKTGPRHTLVWAELECGGKISRTLGLFDRPRRMSLPDPAITYRIEQTSPVTGHLHLTARHPTLWVRIELATPDVDFSDNFFHLEAGRERTIAYALRKGELSEPPTVRITTLKDSY